MAETGHEYWKLMTRWDVMSRLLEATELPSIGFRFARFTTVGTKNLDALLGEWQDYREVRISYFKEKVFKYSRLSNGEAKQEAALGHRQTFKLSLLAHFRKGGGEAYEITILFVCVPPNKL